MNSPLDPMLEDEALRPPMSNGEIAFEAPWQGRVFGVARTLAEQGHFSWDEFRAHLIHHIELWDRSEANRSAADGSEDYQYYDHFLLALQSLLAEKGLVAEGALQGRFDVLRQRPHDHDHRH